MFVTLTLVAFRSVSNLPDICYQRMDRPIPNLIEFCLFILEFTHIHTDKNSVPVSIIVNSPNKKRYSPLKDGNRGKL